MWRPCWVYQRRRCSGIGPLPKHGWPERSRNSRHNHRHCPFLSVDGTRERSPAAARAHELHANQRLPRPDRHSDGTQLHRRHLRALQRRGRRVCIEPQPRRSPICNSQRFFHLVPPRDQLPSRRRTATSPWRAALRCVHLPRWRSALCQITS